MWQRHPLPGQTSGCLKAWLLYVATLRATSTKHERPTTASSKISARTDFGLFENVANYVATLRADSQQSPNFQRPPHAAKSSARTDFGLFENVATLCSHTPRHFSTKHERPTTASATKPLPARTSGFDNVATLCTTLRPDSNKARTSNNGFKSEQSFDTSLRLSLDACRTAFGQGFDFRQLSHRHVPGNVVNRAP